MSSRKRGTACLLIAGLMMAATAMPCTGCGDGMNPPAMSEIRQNARSTLGDIRSYHSLAEVRNLYYLFRESRDEPNNPPYTMVTESEVWVKGNDLFKQIVKSSGREAEGILPTESATIFSGNTIATMGEGNIDLNYNNTPFNSYYRSFYLAFDLVGELETLAEVENCTVLGSEEVGGEDAYKVAIDYTAEELSGSPEGSPDREILWVDRESSICKKKESYRGEELIETTNVTTCEVNVDIPASVFSIEIDDNRIRTEEDMGYREIGIDEAEACCGFRPVAPTYLPEGFDASSAGWRDPRASGLPLDLAPQYIPVWFKEYYLSYTDGLAEVNICEARKYENDIGGSDSLVDVPEELSSVTEVDLSGGRTAYYVPETETLGFFLNEIKVKIKANLPLEELVRIAESM